MRTVGKHTQDGLRCLDTEITSKLQAAVPFPSMGFLPFANVPFKKKVL